VETLGDRYRLIEQVGAGGMSVVWRGYDEVLGRSVAIKVLAEGYVSDGAFRERMRREARAAARLCHPQVTTVYDLGEHDGAPYMVMEMVGGPSLADELRDGPLPWRRALGVCADVAAGLAAVHEAGLVHRDVKPGNVMICPTGAKLVDFGISAEIGEADDPAPDGTLLGTPAYVAPERLTGGPTLAAADVYAVGLLLYRALTGRLPWRVDTRTQLLRAHLARPPAALPPIPGLPDHVAGLIRRCLAKDPAARPSAADLARVLARTSERRWQLRSVLTGLGLFAPGRAPAGRSRRRGLAAAGALTAAAVAVVAMFSGVFDAGPDDRTHPRIGEPIRAALDTEPASCQVTYQVKTDDGQRFAGALTVRNTGIRAIPESTLGFTVSGDQVVTGDGAEWAREGNTVHVRAGSLSPGAVQVLPFRGTYHGSNPLPARFSLGDTSCEPVVVGAAAAATGGAPPAVPDSDTTEAKKPKKHERK
jgi:eukaryotic-like serine/threonine-protein kinase